jgi:SpoVK/Ycf46/Vps4 family AAA+-type ATPase
MGPIRDLITNNPEVEADQWDQANIRQVDLRDFEMALKNVKSSVGPEEIVRYKEWNKTFGSFDIVDQD